MTFVVERFRPETRSSCVGGSNRQNYLRLDDFIFKINHDLVLMIHQRGKIEVVLLINLGMSLIPCTPLIHGQDTFFHLKHLFDVHVSLFLSQS